MMVSVLEILLSGAVSPSSDRRSDSSSLGIIIFLVLPASGLEGMDISLTTMLSLSTSPGPAPDLK